MQLKSLVGRKTAAVLLLGAVSLGLTGCFADTSSAPPSDPFVNELYNRLNYDRVSAGGGTLVWSPKLANNAGWWAHQMSNANTLFHQNLGALLGTSDYQKYYTLGENILVGPGNMTPAAIEAAWKASPPHWANMTNRSFNVVGIGYYRGPDGRLWVVQEFGGL